MSTIQLEWIIAKVLDHLAKEAAESAEGNQVDEELMKLSPSPEHLLILECLRERDGGGQRNQDLDQARELIH